MTVRLVNRFRLGGTNKPARSNRRAPRHSTSRGVEALEGRQLLSSVTPATVHESVAASPRHAIIHANGRSASVANVSYYTESSVGSLTVTGWQGIRAADGPGQYYITGTSTTGSLLYLGSINGQGMAFPVNDPSGMDTSVYGPNNLGGGHIQLVGTYRPETGSTTSVAINGFVFDGTIADLGSAGSYRTIDYPGATYNYVHSTMGGMAVGNYDGPTSSGTALGPGKAYVYNLATGTFTNIAFPGSVSDNAYGVWYNGGTSYTIVGGYSDLSENNVLNPNQPFGKAFLVDFNSATGRFSDWTGYTDPQGHNLVSHFEGISGLGQGTYAVSVDTAQVGSSTLSQGSWLVVKRNPNGKFSPVTSVNLNFPGYQGVTSNDSVAGNQVVGIFIGNSATFAYQATINGVARATALHNALRGHGRDHHRHGA